MVFTDDIVRVLLAVGRQVAVGDMIAGQALAAEDADVIKPAHMDLVGS